jgi:hypothetical protein
MVVKSAFSPPAVWLSGLITLAAWGKGEQTAAPMAREGTRRLLKVDIVAMCGGLLSVELEEEEEEDGVGWYIYIYIYGWMGTRCWIVRLVESMRMRMRVRRRKNANISRPGARVTYRYRLTCLDMPSCFFLPANVIFARGIPLFPLSVFPLVHCPQAGKLPGPPSLWISEIPPLSDGEAEAGARMEH